MSPFQIYKTLNILTCKVFLSLYIYIALSMKFSVIFKIGLLMFYGPYNCGLLV